MAELPWRSPRVWLAAGGLLTVVGVVLTLLGQ